MTGVAAAALRTARSGVPGLAAAGAELAIGVPASATPAAVRDGPRDLWVLPEA